MNSTEATPGAIEERGPAGAPEPDAPEAAPAAPSPADAAGEAVPAGQPTGAMPHKRRRRRRRRGPPPDGASAAPAGMASPASDDNAAPPAPDGEGAAAWEAADGIAPPEATSAEAAPAEGAGPERAILRLRNRPGGGAGRMACCRARAKTPPWRMASRRVRRPPVARPAKPLPAPLPRCRPAAAAFARRAGDAGMRRWPARRSPGRPHPRPMPPHPPVPRSRAGPKKIGRLGRGVGVARSPRPRARRLAAASTIRRNRVDRSGQRRREARATAAPPGRKRLGRTRGSARGHRATGGATAVIGATGRGGMRRAAAGAMRRARSSANSIRLIRWLIAALRMSRRIAAHGGCIGRSSSGRPPTR